MQKKLFRILLAISLFLFIGMGSASATLIDFETPNFVGESDPTIAGVSFFAGDPFAQPWPNDTFIDDFHSPGTNQFLQSGVDDGTGSSPGMYDSFIGATAVGTFTFDSVTLDFATQAGTLPGAVFQIDALSGGTSVASIQITPADLLFHAYTISFAAGFDTLYIYDIAGLAGGFGDLFEIDNFDYTELSDPGGPDPIPEPGTMLLFGFGLLGLAATSRKRNK